MKEEKWVAAVGKPGRVLAARIMPGNDAINSIIELIKENGFKSGTVIAIGSLNSAMRKRALFPKLIETRKEELRNEKVGFIGCCGLSDVGSVWNPGPGSDCLENGFCSPSSGVGPRCG